MKITFWSTYRRWEDLHSQENTTLSEIRSSRCCLFFLSTVREARTHPLHLRPHPGAPGAEPEAGRGQDLRLLPAKWDLKNLQTSMTSPVITILIPSRTYVYCDCSSIPLLSFLSGDQDDTEYIYTCDTGNKLLQLIEAQHWALKKKEHK